MRKMILNPCSRDRKLHLKIILLKACFTGYAKRYLTDNKSF